MGRFNKHIKSLLLILYLVSIACDSLAPMPDPTNPYDPNNPHYEPAKAIILDGPADGDTLRVSTATFRWTGNAIAGEYCYQFDHGDWLEWSIDSVVTFTYLNEENYRFRIVARADDQVQTMGDTVSVSFTVNAVRGPALMVYPRYTEISAGEECEIEIRAEEVDSLMGVEVEVIFDPAIIRIKDIIYGNFLFKDSNTSISFQEVDNTTGRISAVLVRVNESNPCVSGTGTLAIFKIEALSVGTTDIEINTSVYKDQNNDLIDVTQRGNGIIVVE